MGIGHEDFSNMEVLDGDHGVEGLFDNRGRKAMRNLVHFLPFNECEGNP